MKQKLLVLAMFAALSPLGALAADSVPPSAAVQAQSGDPAPVKGIDDATFFGLNPIALPGYTWGSIMYPNSVISGRPDNVSGVFQGKVEQGADWFKFGDRKQFTLNTYVNVNYTADTYGLPWNNNVKPAIGTKIRMDGDWGVADLGVQYVYEYDWKQPSGVKNSGNGVQVYVDWYSGWNLKK